MKIEKFKETLVAFDFNNGMVNATDMARAYKKRPVDFLRLDSTKSFIEALESDVSKNHNAEDQVVRTVKGGNLVNISQGTWMCELLALKFASWLDPNFEIFVYKVFKSAVVKVIEEHKSKLKEQQSQLDYFWDKSDQRDLY